VHRKLDHRGDPQVPQVEAEGQVFLGTLLVMTRMIPDVVIDQRLLTDILFFNGQPIKKGGKRTGAL